MFEATVIRPYWSTVITGTLPPPPYVPAVTPEFAKDNATLPFGELAVMKLLLTIFVPDGILIDELTILVIRP